MCGQFAILGGLQAVKDYYNFLKDGDFILTDNLFYSVEPGGINLTLPNKFIKPYKYAPIVCCNQKNATLTFARWGLVPFWAKDEQIAIKTINARIETLRDKPSFRYAYQTRRCLIPHSGFYEKGEDKKQHYYTNPDDTLKSFAGLYEIWGANKLQTFTIVTREGNIIGDEHDPPATVAHARMPLTLNQEEAIQWLING